MVISAKRITNSNPYARAASTEYMCGRVRVPYDENQLNYTRAYGSSLYCTTLICNTYLIDLFDHLAIDQNAKIQNRLKACSGGGGDGDEDGYIVD